MLVMFSARAGRCQRCTGGDRVDFPAVGVGRAHRWRLQRGRERRGRRRVLSQGTRVGQQEFIG